MFAPSVKRGRLLLVAAARSEPARSIMDSLAQHSLSARASARRLVFTTTCKHQVRKGSVNVRLIKYQKKTDYKSQTNTKFVHVKWRLFLCLSTLLFTMEGLIKEGSVARLTANVAMSKNLILSLGWETFTINSLRQI